MTRVLVLALALLASPAPAQVFRLPLPVDSLMNGVYFESPAPAGSVLTGLLIPSAGPLTSWAPVFSGYQVDGTLTETQTGAWVGPRPDKWLKLARPGFVVGGFRVLVRVKPLPVQTRQVQVFWMPWKDGAGRPVATSPVYGLRSEGSDEVKVVELTLPEGAVPLSLYGQTLGAAVAQVSLTVRPAASSGAGSNSSPAAPPAQTSGPSLPSVPSVEAPKATSPTKH